MNLPTIEVDKDEIALKGQRIYDQTLEEKLEKEHRGEIVAIEVRTGDYFLGKRGIEAITKARKKYPNAVFYLVKIGFPAVHRFR